MMSECDGIKTQKWFLDPASRKVLSVLNQTEDQAQEDKQDGEKTYEQARYVGGCVRNALLGMPVSDIDIATTLTPEQVIARFEAEDITVIPTGLKHGTVTILLMGKHYEVTTLRQDVETDGRHAKVLYTDDWQSDASRRDFTVNALYCDGEGRVYDYYDGLKDIKSRHIRFIGDPQLRIKEDALRILRFFRFTAHYATEINKEGLEACIALKDLISTLSAERIQSELLKLLSSDNAVDIVQLMRDNGIAEMIFPFSDSFSKLKTLIEKEQKCKVLSVERRLVSLIETQEDVPLLVKRLKLSNQLSKRLETYFAIKGGRWLQSSAMFKQGLYYHGRQALEDLLLLDHDTPCDFIDDLRYWQIPVFPLTGDDLKRAGYKEGQRLGQAYKAVETWWVEQGFKADKKACLERLKLEG